MTTQHNKRTVGLVSSIVILLMASAVFYNGKNKAVNKLNDEKIVSEKLLSETKQLDKKITSIKDQLAKSEVKNSDLSKTIDNRNKELSEKSNEINKLLADKASVNKLKKKIAELETLNAKINNDIADAHKNNSSLIAENSKLNKQINEANNELQALVAQNAFLQAMIADNYRVEALKKHNDKLTIRAKRTNKLQVSFDMPTNNNNSIVFKITDPKGNEISSVNNKQISYNTTDKNLTADNNNIGAISVSRTELTYTPDKKLDKGIYTIKVYNGDKYVGSTQMKLK